MGVTEPREVKEHETLTVARIKLSLSKSHALPS